MLIAIAIIGIGVSCEKPGTNTSTTTNKRTYYIDYDLDGTKVRYEDTLANFMIIHSKKNDNLEVLGDVFLPWEGGTSNSGIAPFGANGFGFPKFYLKFRIGNFSKIKLNEKIYNDTLTSKNISQIYSKTIFSIYKKLSPITPIVINTWIDTSALNYEAGYLNTELTNNSKDGNWSPSFKIAYVIVNKIEEIKYPTNNMKVITGEIGGTFRKYKQCESSKFRDRLENKFLGTVNTSVKFSLPFMVQ